MAMNDYGNAPPNAGNDAPADEEYGGQGGEKSVTCLHVYLMADGTFRTTEAAGEPVPEGAATVRDLQGVIAQAQEYFAEGEDPDALAAAQKGYGKPREMSAPNPGGLFGE
jgi:hypothetical protein